MLNRDRAISLDEKIQLKQSQLAVLSRDHGLTVHLNHNFLQQSRQILFQVEPHHARSSRLLHLPLDFV
ncbi:MAG: hypothetical protein BWY82_02958 [Verrucomicrobia bacterium ADurb.Bin474]|nr:MAG: hypothetical protein BWY82_02958 [Verrucomicrobia bacterium ADurb.Bin474]